MKAIMEKKRAEEEFES